LRAAWALLTLNCLSRSPLKTWIETGPAPLYFYCAILVTSHAISGNGTHDKSGNDEKDSGMKVREILG